MSDVDHACMMSEQLLLNTDDPLVEWGGGCGNCYDFFINHLTYTTLATALLTDE
jgi:hypothetical protein